MPPSRRARRPALSASSIVLLIVIVVLWVWVVQPALDRADASAPPPTAPPTAQSTEAGDLVVAEPSSATPYDRDAFGPAWADVDGNGCDTRNDVLIRDLIDIVFRADSNGCIVRTGRLLDPYTGATIEFVRGPDTSDAVQIDHVVPLSYAWQHGASEWAPERLEAFANDPANLVAVDGPSNQSKSDSGPGEWMPPRAEEACAYIARFVGVIVQYGLSVAPSDADAIATVEAGCAA